MYSIFIVFFVYPRSITPIESGLRVPSLDSCEPEFPPVLAHTATTTGEPFISGIGGLLPNVGILSQPYGDIGVGEGKTLHLRGVCLF